MKFLGKLCNWKTIASALKSYFLSLSSSRSRFENKFSFTEQKKPLKVQDKSTTIETASDEFEMLMQMQIARKAFCWE